MEKLDRLGWAAGIAFTAYGLSIGVRVSDRSALARIRELLPPGWKPAIKPTVQDCARSVLALIPSSAAWTKACRGMRGRQNPLRFALSPFKRGTL